MILPTASRPGRGAPLAPALALCLAVLAAAPQGSLAETGGSPDALSSLRAEALSLANAARRERGLAPLEPDDRLDAAAQGHAEDMLARDYYSHTSPEGDDDRDRFLAEGGSRWQLVAENIARCRNCPTPPTAERVQAFHEGWMDSPPHRENLLAAGLQAFGFGIAGEDGRIFAVQTFAGAGSPRDSRSGPGTADASAPLPEGEAAAQALAAVNRAREDADVPPLQPSEALDQVARRLLPEAGDDALTRRTDDLFGLLPEEAAGDWRQLDVLAAACGGCGSAPVAADVRGFVEQWLDDPQRRATLLAPGLGHLGFALDADGSGRKTGIAVAGRRR